MTMFTNSCCARSLGVKSQGRKTRVASVASGAAGFRLRVWKALCDGAEREHGQALVWTRWEGLAS